MPKFHKDENIEPLDSNKWLKKLQQESWELELLVSGFSILLLLKGIEWLTNMEQSFLVSLNFEHQIANVIIVFFAIVILALHALVLNLAVHLIFRGFWVGIVGLGSVAPKADFEKLKYSKFFTQKLKKQITSLDELVIMVDKISSVVFAFAFLVIFLLISIALFFSSLIILGTIGQNVVEFFNGIWAHIFEYVFNIIVFAYLGFGVIYLVDFLTFGFIKKINFFSKIYYPFYKLFGWITLASVYRTIYYNLISRFSKKRTALILIPYLILLIALPGVKLDHYIYYPDKTNEFSFVNNFYENERTDEMKFVVSIPSYIIDKEFLPLFIKYDPNDNLTMKKLCPDYTPKKKEGLNTGIRVEKNEGQIYLNHSTSVREPYPEKALDCLKLLYKIKLNDSWINPDEFYFRSIGEYKGIFTVLDLDTLPRGINELIIYRKEIAKDSVFNDIEYAKVPFWYQK